jgi:hypothetical protein
MNGLAEVISLESWRHRARKGTTQAPRKAPPEAAPRIPPTAALAPAVQRRRLVVFCVVLAALMAALMLLDRTVLPHPPAAPPVASLSAPVRQGLYERTVADVAAGCTGPEATTVRVLRDHCVTQARLLEKLPECTGDCARLARLIIERR